MLEIIETLQSVDWGVFLGGFAVLVVAVPKIKKYLEDFESESGFQFPWTTKKKAILKRFEDLENKYEALNKRFDDTLCEEHKNQEVWHQQSIDIRTELKNDQDSIKNDVKTLIEKFDAYVQTDNKRTIATLRTSLWRMHRDFMDQGYITPDGLKTFKEMGTVYEDAGGNDIYHEKLKPEVLSLEIRYPEGGVYEK